MKSINLAPLAKPESPSDTPRNIFTLVLRNPPQGADFDEQRRRMRVLDALEALSPEKLTLGLEDADHDVLAQALRSFKFPIVSRDIIHACEAALTAE